MPIKDISDTARLTAYARAIESKRPDALFSDPYAGRLAGTTGALIGGEERASTTLANAIACRTAVFDELITMKIREISADLVLNLAAGLDTRPWRLSLPSQLQWVDVDLPDILSYKNDLMRAEQASCSYKAIAADLSVPDAIDRVFDSCGYSKKAVVVTEGVLIYLSPESVCQIADSLIRHPAVEWWITDIAGPRAIAIMEREWGPTLQGARFQFAPANATEFFLKRGWRETEFRSSQTETLRLGRAPKSPLVARILFRLSSKSLREEILRLSGCMVMRRAATS